MSNSSSCLGSYFNIEKLNFSYPEKRGRQSQLVVKDFSAEIAKGEIVALIGSSGSGKSTILRLLTGLEQPLSGKISLDGETLFERAVNSTSADTDLAVQKRNIGLIFQDYALFPHLSVLGNIKFGLPKYKNTGSKTRARINRSEQNRRALELLQIVRLEEHADKHPHQLSGGQQQRIAIARALAAEPKVLLLDEPFSNLDTELRCSVRCEVRDIIKAAKVSAILVTHDEEDVAACADRSIKI